MYLEVKYKCLDYIQSLEGIFKEYKTKHIILFCVMET